MPLEAFCVVVADNVRPPQHHREHGGKIRLSMMPEMGE